MWVQSGVVAVESTLSRSLKTTSLARSDVLLKCMRPANKRCTQAGPELNIAGKARLTDIQIFLALHTSLVFSASFFVQVVRNIEKLMVSHDLFWSSVSCVKASGVGICDGSLSVALHSTFISSVKLPRLSDVFAVTRVICDLQMYHDDYQDCFIQQFSSPSPHGTAGKENGGRHPAEAGIQKVLFLKVEQHTRRLLVYRQFRGLSYRYFLWRVSNYEISEPALLRRRFENEPLHLPVVITYRKVVGCVVCLRSSSRNNTGRG